VLAKVRVAAARRVLTGAEVWLKTYRAVAAAAAGLGITDLPPPAPRASRRTPPVDVDALVAEAVAEWQGVSRGQTARIEELQAIIVGLTAERDFARDEVVTLRGLVGELRARVAELEAASAVNAAREPLASEAIAAPATARAAEPRPAPPARLAVVPPERKVVTVVMPGEPMPVGRATG
jgi:hypothetical protein